MGDAALETQDTETEVGHQDSCPDIPGNWFIPEDSRVVFIRSSVLTKKKKKGKGSTCDLDSRKISFYYSSSFVTDFSFDSGIGGY